MLSLRQYNICFKLSLNSFMRNKYIKGLINEFLKENNNNMPLFESMFSPMYSLNNKTHVSGVVITTNSIPIIPIAIHSLSSFGPHAFPGSFLLLIQINRSRIPIAAVTRDITIAYIPPRK